MTATRIETDSFGPITVDADGYLVARSDFTVPVGPSFFERDSQHDFKEGDR